MYWPDLASEGVMVRYGSPAKRRAFIKQRDEKDCGPACLCSICMHYGALPLAKAREMAKSDLQGTSLYGMAKAALRRHLRHPERPKMPRRTSTTAFPRSYPTSAMRCLEGLIPRSSWPGPCMLSPTQWSPRCRPRFSVSCFPLFPSSRPPSHEPRDGPEKPSDEPENQSH